MSIIWLDESGVSAPPPSSLIQPLASLADAFVALRQIQPQTLVVALPLSTSTPPKVLEWAKLYSSSTDVLFYRQDGTTEEALTLIKAGATHYFDHEPSLGEIERRREEVLPQIVEATATELSDEDQK
jgi:hypothetical protein